MAVAEKSGNAESPRVRGQAYLRHSAELKLNVASTCIESILDAVTMITAAFRSGNKIMLCGNGGSAADCQHLAAEFVGVLNKDFQRAGLPAIALTVDTSFLTAFANDFGFDHLFERQVQALGIPGDVLLGISTSGNSNNVIRAFEAAQAAGIKTIALTGSGGRLSEIGDVSIAVPSAETQHVQEAHLAIEHLICDLVQTTLFAAASPGLSQP